LPEHDIDKRQYAVTPVVGRPDQPALAGRSTRKRMDQGGNRHAG